MLYPINRAILRPVLFLLMLFPSTVLAEVSDKEPAAQLFWTVGLAAALLCLVAARIKPWLGFLFFVPAAVWFASLYMEMHSADVGPHLRLEQGAVYYWQAYAAFAVVACGLALGWLWHRRRFF